MNHRKFSSLAALAGARDSKATAAARLVLVEGLTVSRAARQVGIAQPTAYKAVKRIEAAYVKAVVLNEELRGL